MLASFLSSYPTGSLLTELVQIYNGKYIVKASLQIEAVTRATAMAAAENLETAEDSARQRVLAFFVGNEGLKLSSNGTVPQPVTVQVQVQEAKPILSSSSADNEHNQSDGAIETIPVEIHAKVEPASNVAATDMDNVSNESVPLELPDVEKIVAPTKTKTNSGAKSKTNQDLRQLTEATTKSDVAPEIPSLSQFPTIPEEPVKEPLFDTYEEFTPKESQFESFETSSIPKVNTLPNNVTPFTGRNYNPPEEIELPPVDTTVSTTSTTKRKKKTDTTTTDQSDDIAKIGIEMQRLGWTTEQGRDYLVKQYGKRSRHLLSPDELRDFRSYLESQPTPEDPLAFDPIAGF